VVAALLADPDDTEQLADAMARIARDKALREGLRDRRLKQPERLRAPRRRRGLFAGVCGPAHPPGLALRSGRKSRDTLVVRVVPASNG